MTMGTLRDLYRSRQLILTLTSRDLKARYRGSALGYFWSLANPLMLLGVYALVFTHFFARPAVDGPYPLFLFVGILPWTFFAGACTESTNAIISNSGLIKKVMFPAETLPLVVVFAHLVHFALAIPILLAAIAIGAITSSITFSFTIALAPLIAIVLMIFVVGIALIVSSASVLFRDLRDIVMNLLTLGFFLTPIIYPIDSAFVSTTVRILLRLNPMTPFVLAFQDVFFYGRVPSVIDTTLMLVYASLSFFAGFTVFERLRDTLAEAI